MATKTLFQGSSNEIKATRSGDKVVLTWREDGKSFRRCCEDRAEAFVVIRELFPAATFK